MNVTYSPTADIGLLSEIFAWKVRVVHSHEGPAIHRHHRWRQPVVSFRPAAGPATTGLLATPKGAERIAALWAEARKVTQITSKPNWTKHAKAAPFRRNDEMLSVMPTGVIIFPGSGIKGNLADKTRRLGIPVWQAAEGGA